MDLSMQLTAHQRARCNVSAMRPNYMVTPHGVQKQALGNACQERVRLFVSTGEKSFLQTLLQSNKNGLDHS